MKKIMTVVTLAVFIILFSCPLSTFGNGDSSEGLDKTTGKLREETIKLKEAASKLEEATSKLKEVLKTDQQSKEDIEKKLTFNFQAAKLSIVLRILSDKTGAQFILGEGLENKEITAYFFQISPEEAIETIAKANGLYYEKIPEKNIYLITTPASIRISKELSILKEPLITKIFRLKYVSAKDIKPIIERALSPNGKIEVFTKTVRKGWELGGVSTGEKEMGKKVRMKKEEEEIPKLLVITDTPFIVKEIGELVSELDVKPQQVYIDAIIVEVNSNVVQNLGVKWSGEAEVKGGVKGVPYPFKEPAGGIPGFSYGEISFSGVMAKLQVLEETGEANILSNPRVMVMDNHEAVIIVGERYPIMTTTREESTSGTTTYLTGSLDHYEPIGISLRVIPHIIDREYINMVIHPEVTSLGEEVTAGSEEGILSLPRINTREVDTNVVVKSKETIVIGGLLKKSDEKNVYKIPLLGDIPLLGYLFKRVEKRPSKIDLLIFITPQIVGEEEVSRITEESKENVAPAQK